MTLATPEFLQTKTYNALRDRLMFQHGGAIQAGVWADTDFKVVQRAAGANMSVDVGAGYGLVNANDPGNLGLYHVQNDATMNVVVTTANATNPRLDQVYVLVNDTTHGGDGSDTPQLLVSAGTATAGATLDNRTGAATLPNGSLRIADVLVPAASSSVVTANIRDRRPWARGAYSTRVGTGIGNYSTSSNTPVVVDSNSFLSRVECSGAPMEFHMDGNIQAATAAISLTGYLYQDGVMIMQQSIYVPTISVSHAWSMRVSVTPAAGSHVFDWYYASSSAGQTVYYYNDAATRKPRMFIREDVRPNALNN
jgi:hypothetical protein